MSKITKTQVQELNEKHGYFEFGDAQGDVSLDFANDAIEKYLAMREAAPDMYEALMEARSALRYIRESYGELDGVGFGRVESRSTAALAKADGKGE